MVLTPIQVCEIEFYLAFLAHSTNSHLTKPEPLTTLDTFIPLTFSFVWVWNKIMGGEQREHVSQFKWTIPNMGWVCSCQLSITQKNHLQTLLWDDTHHNTKSEGLTFIVPKSKTLHFCLLRHIIRKKLPFTLHKNKDNPPLSVVIRVIAYGSSVFVWLSLALRVKLRMLHPNECKTHNFLVKSKNCSVLGGSFFNWNLVFVEAKSFSNIDKTVHDTITICKQFFSSS